MQAANKLPDIRKLVLINASFEEVWEYISSAEGIASWWMPSTFEPVLGHEFILHAGDFGDSPCKVTEFEPKNRVGFDWGKDWHLTFGLKDLGDNKTEFTLIHSGWGADKVTEFGHPHTMVRPIMENGWDQIGNGKLRSVVEG